MPDVKKSLNEVLHDAAVKHYNEDWGNGKHEIVQKQLANIVQGVCNVFSAAIKENVKVPNALSAILFCAITANAVDEMEYLGVDDDIKHDAALKKERNYSAVFFYINIINSLPADIIQNQNAWREKLRTMTIRQALHSVVENFLNQGNLQHVNSASRFSAVSEIAKELMSRVGDKTKTATQHAKELVNSMAEKLLDLMRATAARPPLPLASQALTVKSLVATGMSGIVMPSVVQVQQAAGQASTPTPHAPRAIL